MFYLLLLSLADSMLGWCMEKLVPMPLFLPQIPHALAWCQTREIMVNGQ